MKKRINKGLRIGTMLAVVLLLLMGNFQPVQAATCIWTGGDSTTDWNTAGNWSSCNGGVPGSGDNVVIGNVSIDPILTTDATIDTLTINSNGVLNIGFGSTLTVSSFDLFGHLTGLGNLEITGSMYWGSDVGADDGLMDGSGTTTLNSGASLSFQTAAYQRLYERHFINEGVMNQSNAYGFIIDRGGILTNNGTFNVNNGGADIELFKREDYPGNGLVENAGTIMIYDGGTVTSKVVLNNTGTIQMETGILTLSRSGTHTGSINGQPGSWIIFNNADTVSLVEHTFQNGSSLTTSNVLIDGANLDVSGTFNIPITTGTTLSCQGGGSLAFQEAATIMALSEKITLSQCHMSLPASLSGLIQPKLRVSNSSQLTNLGDWDVSTELLWYGGIFDGTGTTTVLTGSTYRMFGVGGLSLSGQTLINQSTAKWEANTITLSNDAAFTNEGTFEAKATTSMNGGTDGLFDNQGLFVKKTDSTTTTMNIDFTNAGEIFVEAGTLVFPDGLTSTSGTEIVLGGNLESTGPLDLQGATLSGIGTVDGNLNNAGTVAPGTSPGKITVTGDYTQTSAGGLEIEIGGTTAETEFDVLVIEGSAAFAGTLNITLLDGFIPAAGDQFEVLNFASYSGDFETVNLPDLPTGKYWERSFTETTMVLTVEENYMVFIPLVIR
ncbi:MAG: hypothetical protein CL609_17715 [Anaerolineaceae bacterium]|nr:hypothetical protein [Anaerolineaceae bacterium]